MQTCAVTWNGVPIDRVPIGVEIIIQLEYVPDFTGTNFPIDRESIQGQEKRLRAGCGAEAKHIIRYSAGSEHTLPILILACKR